MKRFWPLILILLVIALVFAMGWNRYLSLDTLRDHGGWLKAMVERRYWLVLLILMAVFAGATASVLPGVFFLTVAAGFLFGPWVGGVATAAAATAGALVVYVVARTAAGEALRKRGGEGVFQRVCDAIDRDTFWYVLAARLAVVAPFHMINLAAGAVQVRLKPYVVATFIGLLPAHLIYCWIGSRLEQLLAVDPDPDLRSLFARFALPLAGVFVLAVLLPLGLKAVQARMGRSA